MRIFVVVKIINVGRVLTLNEAHHATYCQIEQMARKREKVRHQYTRVVSTAQGYSLGARATLLIDATKSWLAVVYEAVVKFPR
jgi:hypothetical protein